MELSDNGWSEILWSRRRRQGQGDFFKLSNTCHSDARLQFVPIMPFQIQKLSDAMHNEDKEEGLAQLREVLAFLGLPR